MPRLSVVIPTLGRPAKLARALQRLDAQEDAPEFEVIVAADAAERDMDAVRTAAGRHQVVQAQRPGVSAARNAGLREAAAPIVVFLGDDILAEPRLLAAHHAVHVHEVSEELAAQGHVRWADELGRSPFMDFLDEGRWQFDFDSIDSDDAGWGRLYACNLSIKRSFLEDADGFDESFEWGYEELELSRRLLGRGLVLRWAPAARAEHLHQPTLEAWRDRMRRVARAERQMIERHPDVEPFFALRAARILGRPGSGLGRHLVQRFPRHPRVRASAFLHYERELASAFQEGAAAEGPLVASPPA